MAKHPKRWHFRIPGPGTCHLVLEQLTQPPRALKPYVTYTQRGHVIYISNYISPYMQVLGDL